MASTSFRHFNDESPLGLRRILSQSTDSLNMRNRTLSVESLIDEGEQAQHGGDGWCEKPGREEGRGSREGPRSGEESCILRWLLHRYPGAEVIYNELMSDFEMDEKDFAADSWSLAVDSSFLQQHKKEVMKQQDVIYGKPQGHTSFYQTLLDCICPVLPTCQDTMSLCTYFLVPFGVFFFF